MNIVPASNKFKPVEMDLDDFYDYWLKDSKTQEQLVGINWSGKNAIGYDLPPDILIEWINKIKPKRKSLFNRILGRK